MTTTEFPPTPPTTQPAAPTNGKALASLILGIVSLFANLLLIPTILGIIFGVIGLSKSRVLGRKGMAIAGIVLSVVGAIVGIIVFASILGGIGKAAEVASTALETPAAAAADGDGTAVDDADSQAADDSAVESAADIPDGYKAVTDDVWFKWGKTDDSNGFTVKKTATVITPNGCGSLLLEANEYDKSGTNVGSTIASASNLAAGDKAKVEFTWLTDDGVDSVKLNDVTCF